MAAIETANNVVASRPIYASYLTDDDDTIPPYQNDNDEQFNSAVDSLKVQLSKSASISESQLFGLGSVTSTPNNSQSSFSKYFKTPIERISSLPQDFGQLEEDEIKRKSFETVRSSKN